MKDYASALLGNGGESAAPTPQPKDYAAKLLGGSEKAEAVKPVDQRGMSWGDAGLKAVSNLPDSAWKFATDLGNAVIHPVQTLKGVYMLGSGAVQKAIPGRQGNEVAFDAFVDDIVNRYGSAENFKQTLAKDPVGVLADASTILMGTGAAIKGAGLASKAGKLANVGKAIGKAGAVIDPLNVARQGAALPFRAAPVKWAEDLYMSALKPSTKLKNTTRGAMFETAYKNKIPVSSKGVSRVHDLLDADAPAIDKIIKQGAEAGDTINGGKVLNRLDDVRDYYKSDATPRQPGKAIDRVGEEFAEAHIPDGGRIPVDKAQNIKRVTQGELRKKYGERKTARDEARKAVARGLREELAAKYPELKKLNENSSELRALDGELEKAVSRIQNTEPLSLRGTALLGGGVAVGSPELVALAAGLNTLSMPSVKSRLAIALARARKMPKLTTPKAKYATSGAVAGRAREYQGAEQ